MKTFTLRYYHYYYSKYIFYQCCNKCIDGNIIIIKMQFSGKLKNNVITCHYTVECHLYTIHLK